MSGFFVNPSRFSSSLPYFMGGSVVEIPGGYRTHTFLTSDVLRMLSPGEIEYLVVAGGGGGGGWSTGGGGGGGGVLTGSTTINATQTVTVGDGGYAGTGSRTPSGAGTNGGDSSIGSLVVALGGGRGAHADSANGATANSGGSGGGGELTLYTNKTGAAGTNGQGYAGGSGTGSSWDSNGGGGGGGAGHIGYDSTDATYPGYGGDGVVSAISGTSVTYGGGGGGGMFKSIGNRSLGGAGGGGAGGYTDNPGVAGTANTGGGGGGAGFYNSNPSSGGPGGSGIVIIRYMPAFSPTAIAGCVGWFDAADADTITDAGSGAVSQWNDKSGNSWHATQGTGANRPVTGVNTINGKNVIKFVGASSHKLAATAHQYASASTGNLTVFAVFKPASVSNIQCVADFDYEGSFSTRMDQAIRLNGTTPEAVRVAGGVVTETGSPVASGTVYIASMVHSTSAIELWIDGATNGSSALTGTNGTSTAPLGLGHHPFGAGAQYYTGDIAEVIIYNTNLSSADRKLIEAYLKDKWGTAALPSVIADPTAIAGCRLWFDASDTETITASGGAVSQWDDKSASGFHVVQSTAGNKPTTASHTINGLNVIAFDTNDWLEKSGHTPNISTAFTIFTVYKKTGATNTYEAVPLTLTASNLPRPFDGWQSTRFVNSFGSQTTSAANNIASDTTACIRIFACTNAGTYSEWKTGGSILTSTSNTSEMSSTGQVINIGSRADHVTQFTGDVAEIIAYDTELSMADRTSVYEYLSAKWGIS